MILNLGVHICRERVHLIVQNFVNRLLSWTVQAARQRSLRKSLSLALTPSGIGSRKLTVMIAAAVMA